MTIGGRSALTIGPVSRAVAGPGTSCSSVNATSDDGGPPGSYGSLMAEDDILLTPALPTPTGPGLPALTPPIATPMRPWEELAQPGVFSSLQEARRIERYGQPIAPVWQAVIASMLLMAAVAAGARSVLAFWDRRALLVGKEGELSNAELESLLGADDVIADAALVTLLATAVAGIAVIAWTYRAYRTVAAWRPIELRLRWTVLGWIVPIVNLIVPVRILTEITEGSSRGGHGRRLPLLWWVFWTLPLIGTIGLRGVDPVTAEGFVVWDTIAATSTACTLIAGVALIAIIIRSTIDQQNRLGERRVAANRSLTSA